MPSLLITPEYRELNRRLHAGRSYGMSGSRRVEPVIALAHSQTMADLLDYGCGQGSLKVALLAADPELVVHEYDPAVEGKDGAPEPADLVVCTDVLEHIEPDLLDNVLDHLRSLSRRLLYAVISTRLARKVLEDGRNAHLIVQPSAWWRERIVERFEVIEWTEAGDEIVAVLAPSSDPVRP